MSDEPDYILEIRGIEGSGSSGKRTPSSGNACRWIGVHFDCCGVYLRIYRNRTGEAYEGACPHCGRRARVRVGPGGTNGRLFRAF